MHGQVCFQFRKLGGICCTWLLCCGSFIGKGLLRWRSMLFLLFLFVLSQLLSPAVSLCGSVSVSCRTASQAEGFVHGMVGMKLKIQLFSLDKRDAGSAFMTVYTSWNTSWRLVALIQSSAMPGNLTWLQNGKWGRGGSWACSIGELSYLVKCWCKKESNNLEWSRMSMVCMIKMFRGLLIAIFIWIWFWKTLVFFWICCFTLHLEMQSF